MLIENFKALEHMGVPIYECGSPKLAQYIIKEINLKPIYSYKHKKTNRLIQVFIKTKELENVLQYWSKNNPNKRTEE